MLKTIAHLDLDSFFVSCERRENPQLNGIPLIIGGSSRRGVVASCSYEARYFGVRSAMPMRYALQLCPDAKVIKGDMELYSNCSRNVTEIMTEQAPVLEKASIDEFYIDATGLDRYFGCYKWTSELADKVMKETGLPISFGLSINKTVAKIATGEGKPIGKLEIAPDKVRPFLDPLSIRKIPMLGKSSYQTLARLGIKRIKTLAEMPPEMMQRLMGKNGLSLWKKANALDDSPLVPYSERKSISTERTFQKDSIDIKKLKGLLTGMAEKVAYQMRNDQRLCSVVTVKIRYSNFDTQTQQCRIPYTSCDHSIIEKAHELFDKLYQRRMLIRLIGIKLSGFVRGVHQIDLFEDTPKMISLYQALDQIKGRYGALSVRRAVGL